jgi:hypothetical protein
MKAPSLSDRVVKVRAYLTDEWFGYDHWRARQFGAPDEARPALLLIFATEAERDRALSQFAGPPPEGLMR